MKQKTATPLMLLQLMGNYLDAQSVTINILDNNERPSINSSNTGSVKENVLPDTIIYDAFAIDPDGDTLTFQYLD